MLSELDDAELGFPIWSNAEPDLIAALTMPLDRTFEIAKAFADGLPSVQVLHSEQRGKGLAIQRGVLAAAGEYVFMCDADLSMPIEEISKFIPPQLNGTDIAIASREAPGSVRYNEPYYRHFTGRVFNTLIRLLVLPKLQDTQCGFKAFRREGALPVFLAQRIERFGFDPEVLYIAQKRGLRLLEVPVVWNHSEDSKVSYFRDSIKMFTDLIYIRINDFSGRYNNTPSYITSEAESATKQS